MFMILRKVYEFDSLHSAMLTSAKINDLSTDLRKYIECA